jgi:hypothetical protein
MVLFFCTFLVVTKAFDRVHCCKLFELLVGRIMHILFNFYAGNLVKVSWLGSYSDSFVACTTV